MAIDSIDMVDFPIEHDDVPMSHSYVSHYQRVYGGVVKYGYQIIHFNGNFMCGYPMVPPFKETSISIMGLYTNLSLATHHLVKYTFW